MKTGLLCGGFGDEREISLRTGRSIYQTLKKNDYSVFCVDPLLFDQGIISEEIFSTQTNESNRQDKAEAYYNCLKYFKDSAVEVVLIALHGGAGEDGRVQSLLDMAGLPYTGSGPETSAIGMDKDISKNLFRSIGGSTADWILLSDDTDMAEVRKLGLPLVIKGNYQGSSVGLTIIDDWSDYQTALSRARLYDKSVIAEKFVEGRELTVAILEGQALPVVEIVPNEGVYDYHAKYSKGASQYFAPADLDAELTLKIQEQALLAWKALKLENYARIDFRLDNSNNPYFLEANTLPGMTELSLIPMAAKAAGMDFITLLEKIMQGALRRFKEEHKEK